MLAASDPQPFVPFGRQQIGNSGVGCLGTKSVELVYLKSEEGNTDTEMNENWIIRENSDGVEEELYINGKTVIWSRGNFDTTVFNDDCLTPSRLLFRTYTTDFHIKQALWCTFTETSPILTSCDTKAKSTNEDDTKIEAVCIVDSRHLSLYCLEKEEHITPLPILIASVWSTKFGLMMERATSASTGKTTPQNNYFDQMLPTLYSLTHPMNEITPLLMLKQGGLLSFAREPSMNVVFTCEEPSICVLYDYKTGLHSVWKIRTATEMEIQVMNTHSEASSSLNCTNKQVTSTTITASTTPNSYSMLLGKTSRSSASFNMKTSSPFADSRSTNMSGIQISPLTSKITRSPITSQIPRWQSPNLTTVGNISSKHNKFTRSRISRSPRSSPTYEARLSSSPAPPHGFVPTPISPELCLDYIWIENQGLRRVGNMSAANKVFVSCDFVDQKYLCYLLPVKFQLFCVKLDKTNEEKPGIILGNTTIVAAKDAAYLSSTKIMVVIDTTSNVWLYTGITSIGQVLLGGVSCSSHYLSSSLSFNAGKSPLHNSFQSRANLLCSTRTGFDDLFDMDEDMFSPEVSLKITQQSLNSPSFNLTDPSLLDTGNINSIHDANGMHITLKYSDGSFYRVSFPVLSVSPLVTDCLNLFRNVLPRDICLNLMVAWYVARNAPGTQDISSEQEWQLFLEVLLRSLGYDINTVPILKYICKKHYDSPVQAKKKKKLNLGSDSDWDYLISSKYHSKNFSNASFLLNINQNLTPQPYFEQSFDYDITTSALLSPYFHLIHFSLHLLYEELKLNVMSHDSLPMLAQLLYQLAVDLDLENYVYHYWNDHPQLFDKNIIKVKSNSAEYKAKLKETIPEYITKHAPSIFQHVYFTLNKKLKLLPYPYINRVNNYSHTLIQLVSLFHNESVQYDDLISIIIPPGTRNTSSSQNIITEYLSQPPCYNNYERILRIMANKGMTPGMLQSLPVGLAWYFVGIIHQCRGKPPLDWTYKEYKLISREDLASKDVTLPLLSVKKCKPIKLKKNSEYIDEKTTEVYDGIDSMDDEVTELLWHKDGRIHKVREMLKSASPIIVNVAHKTDENSNEYIEEQEKQLFSLCSRAMACCVGRGMFTLHTVTPSLVERLQIPSLCLKGKSGDTGVAIEFSRIDVASNMDCWPLFHNGVAAGLRIKPSTATIDSTWILFNKPKGTGVVVPEHGGFLMALGLTGHLTNLEKTNMFDYISRYNDLISIAIIIGLSASLKGTRDAAMTKLLSLHVESLLPPTTVELDIEHHVQVAALLGVGMVYQGSSNMHMVEVLLSEIGRPPGPEMDNSVDREAYALAAGFGLGLILLGKGTNTFVSTDHITSALRCYMLGGPKQPLKGSQKEKYKSPSYQIREGDNVNQDVTGPAATMALGLIYFDTNNRMVADWMKSPDTQYVLDSICPDFLLQRTLARSLIFWNDITPTVEWVESHVPPSIRPYCLVKPKPDTNRSNVDLETMNQAYCNIISGACMAVGLRYAGSGDNTAYQTLHYFSKIFQNLLGKSISELAGKATIETAVNVTLLSLAMVAAGTGDLDVLRMCRNLASRVVPSSNSAVTYGSQLATHMALGLLFLGGGRYTLSTSPDAVAAMLIAFYPKFPIHSNDNRYHLQAFRHLYVLASEPRLLIPRDIDNGSIMYVHLKITWNDEKCINGPFLKVKAPCLIPELKYIKEIAVDDERYWPVIFTRGKNWEYFEDIMKTSYLDIKQRIGWIPYHEDLQQLELPSEIPDTEPPFSQTSVAHLISVYTSGISTMLMKLKEFITDQSCIPSLVSRTEFLFYNLFKMIIEDCVQQDKIYLIPYWLSTLKILQNIYTSPDNYNIWQIKLFDTAMRINSIESIKSYSNQFKRMIPKSAESIANKNMDTMIESGDIADHPHDQTKEIRNSLFSFITSRKMFIFSKAVPAHYEELPFGEPLRKCFIPNDSGNMVLWFTRQRIQKYMKEHGITLTHCFQESSNENKAVTSRIKSACLTLHDIPLSLNPLLITSADEPLDVIEKTRNESTKTAICKMLNTIYNRR